MKKFIILHLLQRKGSVGSGCLYILYIVHK